MTPASERQSTLAAIDEETLSLVRIAAAIAGSDESTTRTVMEAAVSRADHAKVDEVILQSYLFAGFPRTLNAARIWRAVSDSKPPAEDQHADLSQSASWTSRGEDTCRVIYGESYEMLRRNIRGRPAQSLAGGQQIPEHLANADAERRFVDISSGHGSIDCSDGGR
jgi:4-carboxymuconolactone decarboxylase